MEDCIMIIWYKLGRWRQIICKCLVRSNSRPIKLGVWCTLNSRISIISIISRLALPTVVRICWRRPLPTKQMCLAVFPQQISWPPARSTILTHKPHYSNSSLVTTNCKSRSSFNKPRCNQLKEELRMSITRCHSITLRQSHLSQRCNMPQCCQLPPKTKSASSSKTPSKFLSDSTWSRSLAKAHSVSSTKLSIKS